MLCSAVTSLCKNILRKNVSIKYNVQFLTLVMTLNKILFMLVKIPKILVYTYFKNYFFAYIIFIINIDKTCKINYCV